MKKNRFLMILVNLALVTNCFATSVETTKVLNVYYPDYSRIDLVCDRHFTTGGSLLDSLNK